MIRKAFWIAIAVFSIAASYILLYHPDDVVMGLNNAVVVNDKDPTPSNPNRPYYDIYGNEFSYNGQLIKVAKICVIGNPYCKLPKYQPIKIVPSTNFRGK